MVLLHRTDLVLERNHAVLLQEDHLGSLAAPTCWVADGNMRRYLRRRLFDRGLFYKAPRKSSIEKLNIV
jgi:hypothetical protein